MPLIISGKKLDNSVVLQSAFFAIYSCTLQDYLTFDMPRKPMTRVSLVLVQYETSGNPAEIKNKVIQSIDFGFEHDPIQEYTIEEAEAYLINNGIPSYSGWQFDSVATYLPPQG